MTRSFSRVGKLRKRVHKVEIRNFPERFEQRAIDNPQTSSRSLLTTLWSARTRNKISHPYANTHKVIKTCQQPKENSSQK